MFIWVHATSSTWQIRTISVSSYVATSKPWAAPPFSPQLSGMSTWPTRKSSTFMVGPRRSRSIFQDLRRFQLHCQSRHYGGQQKQKVRTVRWSSQSLNASTITSLWPRKGSQTSVFRLWGRFKEKEAADHCWWHSSGSCCWNLPLRRRLFVQFWRRNTETGLLQFSRHRTIRITFAGAGTVCDVTETGRLAVENL